MTPEQIKSRLETSYTNSKIQVHDLTGTQDHYEVFIESDAFTGKSRIQCHRMVMDVFNKELKSGEVHALTIRTQVPQKSGG